MVGLRRRHLVAAANPGAAASLSATATLNASDHANRTLLLTGDGSTAQTYTLPLATGSGNLYTFYVQTDNSGTYIITLSGSDELNGICYQSDGNSDVNAGSTWPALAGDDFSTITLGNDLAELGSTITFKDVASGVYLIHGAMVGSNTTPATMIT